MIIIIVVIIIVITVIIIIIIIIVGYRYLGFVKHWTSLTGSILKEGRVFLDKYEFPFSFPQREWKKN